MFFSKKDKKPGRFRLARRIFWLLVAAAVIIGAYNASSLSITVERVDVEIDNLPDGFVGTKIAVLTDVHSSFMMTESFMRKAATLTMNEKPDMIALTGDFVTGKTKFLNSSVGSFDTKHLDKMVRAFSELKAPLGTYAVLGNHDFWSGEEAVGEIVGRTEKGLGAKWLRNKSITIEKNGATFLLSGIDDYWHTGSVLEAYKNVPTDTARVLLSHNPDVVEELDMLRERADLVISGHTHGGQIKFPIIGFPVIPSKYGQRYLSGLIVEAGRAVYVSRGLGTLLAPIRFGALPEVTIITLKKARKVS
ncbi:MAG: metallophosphoesterase [Deltaproteobacteria bacterium]|nr:metallophosphoesterase [Deltaproteobacteria bacterium]